MPEEVFDKVVGMMKGRDAWAHLSAEGHSDPEKVMAESWAEAPRKLRRLQSSESRVCFSAGNLAVHKLLSLDVTQSLKGLQRGIGRGKEVLASAREYGVLS